MNRTHEFIGDMLVFIATVLIANAIFFLAAATTLYHECFKDDAYNKEIDYMSKRAHNAFQEYAR